MLIVDTHVHASPYWFEPIETLLHEMEANKVAKSVLVQFNGNFHNDYILDCVRRYPGRFAACILVDTAKEDAPAKLEEWAKKGATAVRFTSKTRSPGRDQLAIWRKADELGLAVSVLGQPGDFASGEFRNLVASLPNLRIVIEHYAQPVLDEQSPYQQYRQALLLADYPNTWLKIGGIGELCPRPKLIPASYPFSNIPPLAKMAAEAFGPKRMMFGSDFPPVARREGYHNALYGLMDHLSFLKHEDLEWVFGKTALKVWNFPEGEDS